MAEFFASITLVIWLYLLVGRGMFWRIRESEPGEVREASSRSVAVVIPARNEADSIGRTIASLTGQDHGGPIRIFLVDDDSQDGTTESALRAASEAGRPGLLTVVRARPAPDG